VPRWLNLIAMCVTAASFAVFLVINGGVSSRWLTPAKLRAFSLRCALVAAVSGALLALQIVAGYRPIALSQAASAITPIPLAASLFGLCLGMIAAIAGAAAMLAGAAWLALLLRPRA
jgi:hypothetical protein